MALRPGSAWPNLSTGVRSSVPSEVVVYEEDVANTPKMVNILDDFKPEAIIHFAGSIVVPESVENPIKYYKNNTIASFNLIDACLQTDTQNFVFSSTAAVYGMPQASQVTESSPLNPVSPYGSSKLIVEQMLSDVAAAHNFNYTALRYFNVSGADRELRAGQSTPNTTHLIKLACQNALGLHPVMKVFGTDYDTPDGTCIRDFIHVSDLARAHLNVLDYMDKHQVSSIFNCGTGRGYSVKEILESVQRVSGVKLKIEYMERRLGDPPALIAHTKALMRATGWSAYYTDIDDIVASALAWEKKIMSGGVNE